MDQNCEFSVMYSLCAAGPSKFTLMTFESLGIKCSPISFYYFLYVFCLIIKLTSKFLPVINTKNNASDIFDYSDAPGCLKEFVNVLVELPLILSNH